MSQVICHCRDPWRNAPVAAGDSVNLLGEPYTLDGVDHVDCDYNGGMLVLHPDILLSGTTVTSALGCARKAWLQVSRQQLQYMHCISLIVPHVLCVASCTRRFCRLSRR